MNASKDNDVMIKRLTGKWDVWRNENKDDPWPTDRWVQGLNKKKKKKKKKKRKTQQSTFFYLFPFSWCYHGIPSLKMVQSTLNVPLLYFQT